MRAGLARVRDTWTHIARAEPLGRILVYASLATITVSLSTLLLTVQSLSEAERATLLCIALGAWMLLIALAWTRGRLPLRPVLAAIGITLVCAVATPSHQSNDVYSYAMYGRIITEHHRDPYNTYPMHFEGDPMRRHVAEMWQRTPDVYGLGFTGIAAALAPVIGESTFLARFSYQLLAVGAVVAILWLLWRRTRSPTVLAFAGLHPLIAASVVNGGHNDALMALGVLLGVLLALDRRVLLAALAFAFAVSIKVTALPAAVVLGVWALRRWQRREVVTYGAVVFAFGLAPYLFLNGWTDTLHTQAQMISRQSSFMPLQPVFEHLFALRGDQIGAVSAFASSAIVGALVLFVLFKHTKASPEIALGAVIGAFFVTATWVMPWYAFAAIPLLALRRPTLLTWALALDAAMVLVGDQFTSLSSQGVGLVAHQVLQTFVPLFALAAFIVVIVFRRSEVLTAAAPPPAITGAPAFATSA